MSCETAWAMTPVYSKDPEVLEATPEVLARHMNGLADEKFGAGRWRRLSLETGPVETEPWRTPRQAVALYLTGGDREAADELLSQGAIPEDAHLWRGKARYEPLEADRG